MKPILDPRLSPLGFISRQAIVVLSIVFLATTAIIYEWHHAHAAADAPIPTGKHHHSKAHS